MHFIPQLLLFILLLSTACRNDAPAPPSITFGWFYGECFGDNCIKSYKLDGELLYQDRNHKYPFDYNKPRDNFNFTRQQQAKYELVKGL